MAFFALKIALKIRKASRLFHARKQKLLYNEKWFVQFECALHE